MKLFTIGFTKKSAKTFFALLINNRIKKVIDIRLNNSSQLAGFSKGEDLKYFLEEFCNIDYYHDLKFAPTKEILDSYKDKKMSWGDYERQYKNLLLQREISNWLKEYYKLDFDGVCFLCSEDKSDKCHRRLAVEFIKNLCPESDIKIIHL